MRTSFFIALALAGPAGAADETHPEPVNVISETGHDVGPCIGGATLGYPPQPYKGTASFLLNADPALAARHEAVTRQGSPAWLQQLDGPSGSNRLFTDAVGEGVLVFSVCKPRDCDASHAYGAYSLQTKQYALRVSAGGAATMLGSPAPALKAAMACARSIDDRVRAEAADRLRKAAGR